MIWKRIARMQFEQGKCIKLLSPCEKYKIRGNFTELLKIV